MRGSRAWLLRLETIRAPKTRIDADYFCLDGGGGFNQSRDYKIHATISFHLSLSLLRIAARK